MRPLTPLAIVFALLAALVAWKEASRGGTRSLVEEAKFEPLQAVAFANDDVAKVEVTAPEQEKPAFSLVRQDKGWRVEADFRAPASGAEVKKLLDLLAKAEGEMRADDRSELPRFDLSPDRAVRVHVTKADGTTLVDVAVGRTSGERGAFVRNLANGGDAAYAITADLRAALGLSRSSPSLDAKPEAPKGDHFQDREFPQFKMEKPKRVELLAPGRRVVFEKQKKDESDKTGTWSVAEGGTGDAVRKEGVEAVIRTLGGAFRPQSLVDPAKRKDLGLETPEWRSAVTTEDGVTRAVVGAVDTDGEHYYVRLDAAQDPEVVYECAEYAFHQLFPRGAEILDLPKLDVAKEGPTRVVVEREGRETIDISRKGVKPADEWTLASPKWPLETKSSALRGIGGFAQGFRLTDYVDATDLGPTEITVRFGAAAAPLAALSIGGKAPSGKNRLVSMPGRSGHVYAVADATVDRVAPEPLSLFETRVFHSLTKDDIKSVGAGALSVVRKDEHWALAADDAKKLDAKLVDEWLDKVLSLDVLGIAKAPDDATGCVTLHVEREEGAPIDVQLWPAKDGKRAARVGGVDLTVTDPAGLLPDAASLEAKPEAKEEKKDDEKK